MTTGDVSNQTSSEVVELGDARQGGGKELIDTLESQGIDLSAAFWAFIAELGEWRLVLVTDEVEVEGPRPLLRRAKDFFLNKNGEAPFDLFDVQFVGPSHPSVAALASRMWFTEIHRSGMISGFETDDQAITNIGLYFIRSDMILEGDLPYDQGLRVRVKENDPEDIGQNSDDES